MRLVRLSLTFSALFILFLLFFLRSRLLLPNEIVSSVGLQDYVAFYAAAKAAAAGSLENLYDHDVFTRFMGVERTLYWLFPPSALPLLAGFAALAYPVFKVVMVVSTFVCAGAMSWIAGRSWQVAILGALSPVTVVALWLGQVSAFFGLLLTVGLVGAKRMPVVAGLCLGFLTVKPTYGLMVIPFLIKEKAWTAMGVATAVACALIVGSIVMYGSDQWVFFYQSIMTGEHSQRLQAGISARSTVSDALHSLGLVNVPKLLIYPPLFAAALAGLYVLSPAIPRELVIAYVLLATALVTPYFWIYDYFIINAALLILMHRVKQMPLSLGVVIMVVWFMPMISLFGSFVSSAGLWGLTTCTTVLVFVLASRGAERTA